MCFLMLGLISPLMFCLISYVLNDVIFDVIFDVLFDGLFEIRLDLSFDFGMSCIYNNVTCVLVCHVCTLCLILCVKVRGFR